MIPQRLRWCALCALLLAACRGVPTDTLDGHGGDDEQYAALVAKAAHAFDQQPRSIEAVRESADKYAAALKIRTDDYKTLWHAARSCAWLGEFIPGREERRPVVKDGLSFANTALKLKPAGTEARFYHGVLAGMLGDVDHDYGLDAAKTVESDMKALIESGGNLLHGGPQRVLGLLYMRAPGPPISVGSLRNARKMLSAALDKAPDWPENHLYMAELEFGDEQGDLGAAKARLEKHLLAQDARAPEGYLFEFAAWQQKARELLDRPK